MRKTRLLEIPPEVRAVRERFFLWRKNKRGRERIPDRLWSAAVMVCRRYSVERVSRWLRLNHTALRDRARVGKGRKIARREPATPAFVELVAGSAAGMPEYIVEAEGSQGSRVRVRIRGAGVTEVCALARSLREEAG